MADIDDADLERFVYGSGGGRSAMKNQKMSRFQEEEPEYPVARAEMPIAKPKKKVSLLVEEDDEEDERPKKPISKSKKRSASPEAEEAFAEDDFITNMSRQGKQFTMPIGRNSSQQRGGRKITTRVKLAARALVEQAQEVRLTSDTRQELQMLLDCTDDGTRIDPFVTIYTRVPTGFCVIYLKESIPVSLLLKAIALKATFTVHVTGKAKSQPESFSKVSIKPCKEIKDTLDVQSFEIEKIVDQLMQEGGHDEEQVKAYMYTVGPVSSEQASDLDFIETHVEQVKDILSGKLVVLRDAPPAAPAASAARRAVGGGGLLEEKD